MLDPDLQNAQVKILRTAAQTLQECRMVRFDPHTGTLGVTEAGRIASHFYIQHETMRLFLEELRLDEEQLEELENGDPAPVTDISEARLLSLVAQASEFEQVKLRDEEVSDLRQLALNACPIDIRGGIETPHGKVNVLLQAHISRAKVKEFSLVWLSSLC
jgi:replicative superfamily II helicase